MPRKNKYTARSDGRYETKVSTGKRKPDGRMERITLYAESSKDLEEKVEDLRYKIKHGLYSTPNVTTVSIYADKWLETFKSRKAINTQAMYKNVIDKHIKPSIGILRLEDITRLDCQQMINERFDHYETCNKIALTMRQIQKSAIRDDIIKKPFWEYIEMPKKPLSTKRALTDLEKAAVTTANFSQRDKAFVYLLFGCGLRREEALALKVSDFDLKNREVIIQRKLVFDGNNPILEDGTKTVSGCRTLVIPTSIYSIVRLHTMTRSMCGQDALLFTMQDGGPMSKSAYTKMWRRIIKAMNAAVATPDTPEPIQGLTAHIFRHNYATMLYYSGVTELNAVRLMGHKDGNMIKQVYAHLDERKENTRKKLDAAIVF